MMFELQIPSADENYSLQLGVDFIKNIFLCVCRGCRNKFFHMLRVNTPISRATKCDEVKKCILKICKHVREMTTKRNSKLQYVKQSVYV